MINKMLEEIKKAKSIAILTHESPDGDAVGSSLAMYYALKQLGINADVVIKEFPKMFLNLDGVKHFIPSSDKIYDLVITLDCANQKRLSEQEIFNNAKVTINIDHHATNDDFADINYVERKGPACCLTLVNIFKGWNVTIDKTIGEALTTGIITDTSGFKYNNIKETYEFIADMLDLGVDVTKLYYKILTVNTKAQFELQKLAQERLEFYLNDRVTFTYITQEDDDRLGTKTGDHEGIVEIGKNIEGVEVSIFCRSQNGQYRVSLRSNEYVNVSEIAKEFNGGGHTQASGFMSDLELDELKRLLIESVSKRL